MPAKECENHDQNMSFCNCTYPNCPRHGYCCECLQYHLRNNELPACCFSSAAEKTYDRSFRKFIETH